MSEDTFSSMLDADGSKSYKSMTLNELGEKVATNKDAYALDEIAKRLGPQQVYKVLGRLNDLGIGTLEDAQEVVADAYMEFYENYDPAKLGSAPDKTFYWIRKLVDQSRSRFIRKYFRQGRTPDKDLTEAPWDPVDGVDIAHLLRDSCMHTVQHLPDDLQCVLILRLAYGMTFKQISEEVGRPEGTVKGWYYRALRQVQDGLDDVS